MSNASIPLVDIKADYAAYEKDINAAMISVAASGQYILGPPVGELEHDLAKIAQPETNDRPLKCVSCSDGTAALQLSLMALDVAAGDEVITVPFTWISTVEVISLVGATPIFCDINSDDYLIDTRKLRELITAKTKAVIVVSLFGCIPDLSEIRKILDEMESKYWTRIALIEDAAQSFGARRKGQMSCGSPFATIATTSFFPTKPLGCIGDGGAIFTHDTALADSMRALRNHGKNTTGKHASIGINSRLDTLQAAILLAKIRGDNFQRAMEKRRNVAARYYQLLKDEPRVVLPSFDTADQSMQHVWAVFTIRVRKRDDVVKYMKQNNVQVAMYYPTPVHLQPVYANRKISMPVSELMAGQVMSLPMHPWLQENKQKVVIDTLVKVLDELKVAKSPEDNNATIATPIQQ